jgi:hypothetical protein
MKSYLLVTPFIIMALNTLFGEVKNGYEKDVVAFSASLESLRNFLYTHQHIGAAQKRKTKEQIRSLVNFMVYYQITDSLLKQFKTIAPELYDQMNTLRDAKGRVIDVYVKFISKDQLRLQAAGTASFSQSFSDPEMCNSSYGPASVSVEVWIFNRALWVLSHEFGHVTYAVPNLRSYVKFYKRQYGNSSADVMPGHRLNDPSGKTASKFEERFRKSYSKYLKGDVNPVISPLVLINPIRRNLLADRSN